ncbi:MAG: PAS domain-containing protein [Alphaproteobacteria bacterium]|nr:PAS domain-containing protein [Alphaproteobacteria bacterium]
MPVIQYGAMQPRLRELYAFWDDRRQRSGGKLPSILRVHAESLTPWLSNLVIMTVRREGEFAYRYYPKTFVEQFGVDMSGKLTTELPDAQRALLEHEYDYVRQKRRPTWRVYSGEFDNEIVTWERLILPFAADGEAIDTLLVGVYEAKNAGLFEIA